MIIILCLGSDVAAPWAYPSGCIQNSYPPDEPGLLEAKSYKVYFINYVSLLAEVIQQKDNQKCLSYIVGQ